MSKEITVQTIDELINFIKTTDLKIEKYVEILNAFLGYVIIWTGNEDKNTLIAEIEENRSRIELGHHSGLFWGEEEFMERLGKILNEPA